MSGNPPPPPPAAQRGRGAARGGGGRGGPPPPPSSQQPPPPPPGVGRGRARGGPVAARPGPPGTQPPPPTSSGPPPQGRGLPSASRLAPPGRPAAEPPSYIGQHRGLGGVVPTSAIASESVDASSSRGTGGGASTSHSASSLGRGSGHSKVRPIMDHMLHTRPENLKSKMGTSGSLVKLMTNYFAVQRRPNTVLHQWRATLEPDTDNIPLKRAVVRKVAEKYNAKFVFDGMTVTTMHNIKDQGNILVNSISHEGKVYTVKMAFTGEVKPSESVQYTQILNVLTRRCLSTLKLAQVGKDFFDPDPTVRQQLGKHKLELWPGYKTSMRDHEHKTLLCCETAWKVLRTDTALHVMNEAVQRGQAAAAKALEGAVVMTRYNNRTYKVESVMWKQTPRSTFQGKDGPMTYVDYFKEKWKMDIKDLGQPLLSAKPREKQFRQGKGYITKNSEKVAVDLVPELCNMTGMSESQRSDFRCMADVAVYTRPTPPQRLDALRRFSQRMATTKEVATILSDWNMQLSPELERINGRMFKPETIMQGGKAQFNYRVDNADWGSTFRNAKLFNPVACQKWAVVYAKSQEGAVQPFLKMVMQSANSMSFGLGNPKQVALPDDRPASYTGQLQNLVALGPNMVMAFVPGRRGELHYSQIKKLCCVQYPVPSQVVTMRLLSKPKQLQSVATKVALQMAAKLGGEPWAVSMPLKSLMVIGYDSFHDTASSQKSVGAVVATINPMLTRFTSSVAIHQNNDELHQNMKMAVTKALKSYQEFNGGLLPKRIIVYRDGVGDGQLETVKNHEIRAIKQAFDDMKYYPEDSFTVIVVSKRINSRFFTASNGPPANPAAGTVIDDVVTLPDRYDFFLISQSVRQGTVNPTSYNVIEESKEKALSPDKIQMLTYKLCHLYYNWPGTLRVPMVCQYAHKLAYLVGESLHALPRQELGDLLYYL